MLVPRVRCPDLVTVIAALLRVCPILAQVQHGVQVVYLSKNRLRSLVGLQHFAGLQRLSVADNSLQGVEDLEPLACCSQLTTLNLEGNPMCRMPFYRYATVDSCQVRPTAQAAQHPLAQPAKAWSVNCTSQMFRQGGAKQLHCSCTAVVGVHRPCQSNGNHCTYCTSCCTPCQLCCDGTGATLRLFHAP